MIRNPALLGRIFGTPLMVLPQKADAVIAGLVPRFGLGELAAESFDLGTQNGLTDTGLYVSSEGERRSPGYRVDNGIAIIEVGGVLAHRGGFQADSSYVLGYEAIARRLDAAMADPDVKAVASVFFSPGGEAAGAFQLADKYAGYHGVKPTVAIIDELAASAAFLAATGSDEIVIAPNGYAGSVGVVLRHIDISAALAKEGVSVEHVYSGARKMDGHQFGPLTDEVRARYQSEVNALRQAFAEKVAKYRGLDVADVMATEAAVYRGQEAVDQGFANRIGTADQALADLRTKVSIRASARSIPGGKSMTTQSNADATVTQAELASAKEQSFEEGRKAGAQAEAERIFAILNHPEAEGRGSQAIALAEAGLTAEVAGKVLAATPQAKLEALPGNAFVTHMQALGNPAVGPANDQPAQDPNASQAVWGRAFGRA